MSDTSAPLRRRALLLSASALLIMAIAILDLRTRLLSPGIIYLVPLVLVTRALRPRDFWLLTASLVVLVYTGYYFGPHRSDDVGFFQFRLINRTLTAVAILLSGTRLTRWRAQLAANDDSGGAELGGIGANRSQTHDLLLSALLVTCTFIADLLTPVNYNLPVLYAVPLIILAVLDVPRLLWAAFAVAALCSVVGYIFSPPAGVPPSLTHALVRSRILANAVLLVIVLIGHRRYFCKHVWTIAQDTTPADNGDSLYGAWVCSFCRRRILLPKGEPPVRVDR